MIFEVFGDGAMTGKVIFENTGTGIIFEKFQLWFDLMYQKLNSKPM